MTAVTSEEHGKLSSARAATVLIRSENERGDARSHWHFVFINLERVLGGSLALRAMERLKESFPRAFFCVSSPAACLLGFVVAQNAQGS